MELAQVRLLVADFPACYRFYGEVLGLKPQSGAQDGPYEKFSPAVGSAGIALQDRAMMAGLLGELADAATGHRSLVVLRVDDLDAYCAEIVGRGAVLAHGPAPMTERMRVAHLKDPEGNLVELQEWLLLRT
ncbi:MULTISPECIES: VOC family protein [Streptomyces]|uniref:Extradiol dioxygenase n=1 Tax=Streptomyces venezuelae TaxID=54571 RepID=A0A5P2B972_STRVZ|nr:MULTISPECIES: VOC family protein [Streptomyces]NEA04666.1 VOC family protein [Streptomyces sp. SID10116]MYY85127.1 VOC family protein [Streptomyces sp. SID335]MYZ15496.1 VOC family protein [Streptomyces sp. SID337]MYZ18010.1 VOC family protein [Streptomyces sp. SID337]NDZ90253.1 VOC family protein [Streptomyces sp. SID10115]